MFTSLLLQASGAAGSATGGMADFVTDLSNTIGIDLFDEDIDNVVFQTNEFLCNSVSVSAMLVYTRQKNIAQE